MKNSFVTWGVRLLLPLITFLSLTGCDNSGYGKADPYVITGTVSNGGNVAGTVYARTYKRYELYSAPIDSETGTYTLSVTTPDPPYFLCAKINGARSLYSFTVGSRNSTGYDKTDPSDDIKDQHVNINPITDMIMSLTYLKDTNELVESFTDDSEIIAFPKQTDFEFNQDEIEKLFGTLFEKLCYEDGFDVFHDEWVLGGYIDSTLNALTVDYYNDGEGGRTLKLHGEDPAPFYEYDLGEDVKMNYIQPDEAFNLIILQTGIELDPCLN